jgi:hypothetical protein
MVRELLFVLCPSFESKEARNRRIEAPDQARRWR